MNKVILLDVDGVLNTSDDRAVYGMDYICPEKTSYLAMIVRRTGAKIVYSTSWRLTEKHCSLLDSALLHAGVLNEVIGKTPALFSACRGTEINMWLADNPTDKFVVIDDDAAVAVKENLFPTFFKTKDTQGLTYKTALKIIKVLNNIG